MRNIRQERRIPIADRRLLADLKAIVLERVTDGELILYGSAASGARGPESDYDILVLSSRSLSTEEEDALSDAIYELELAHGVVISTVLLTRDQWSRSPIAGSPYRLSVEREAVAL